jgi:hypothetical protein
VSENSKRHATGIKKRDYETVVVGINSRCFSLSYMQPEVSGAIDVVDSFLFHPLLLRT